ncbi:iron ABC transporter permease [Alphaproteobacteria bacterium KMM 3653]|uniref:Iron ABC transporter permease n=2 Tax=Harenicola maris TaxID=2841044 RepID=A0AAP2CR07_9RHOB|nr:iron ABC transporter permease [Harenicola maris]
MAAQATAQGFAGLGTQAEGFAVPERGTPLTFPQDHQAHPDYRIEWWYITANLTGPDGTDYGVQWTLFRSATAPGTDEGWQNPQVWMGHAALTTPTAHHHAERLARGGTGQAGVAPAPFAAWIDTWQMLGTGPDMDSLALTAEGEGFAYALTLNAEPPLILQGEAGYSVKSRDGQASFYYSQPFYQAQGTLTLPEGEVPVTGTAWLDREWSSQPLSESQTGWDWVSLSLDDGRRIMGFALREEDAPAFHSGTVIEADGTATPLSPEEITLTPLAMAQTHGRSLPVEWQVTLPGHSIDVTIKAVNPEAWMDTTFPYWEGPVRISGSHTGRGYLEMTGY